MTTPLNQLIQDTIFSTDCRPGYPDLLIHSIREAYEALENKSWIPKTLEKTYNFTDEEKEQIANEVQRRLYIIFEAEVNGETYSIDFQRDQALDPLGNLMGDAEFFGSIPRDEKELFELASDWIDQCAEM